MITVMRKNSLEFIAIVVLFIVGLGVSYYILQEQRLRIPVLEERPFELTAEFETAQGVVPGQGQTIRVAGVKVGDVQSVELEGGRAVVTFGMQRDYLPVYKDSTVLLRPQTGLKDMFFQLDPGTEAAGEVEEGWTVPLANTAPDVNLDEILAALDTDTQAYLRLLFVGAGQGLKGRAKDLGELLGSLGPINRSLDQLNSEVATREDSLRRLIHNFAELTTEVGRAESDLTRVVRSSNVALGAIAENDPSVQRAVRLLPGTLTEARRTLASVSDLAAVLGPAFEDLRPFARRLVPLNASTRRLANTVTPILRDEIRPFVRQATEVAPDLRRAANRLSRATPSLTAVARKVNVLGNMAAFNPNGAEPLGTPGRDEGHLFWAGWLGHNGNSIFEAQDAHGLYRRIYLTMGPEAAASILASSPLAPAATGLCALFVGGPFASSPTPSPCVGP